MSTRARTPAGGVVDDDGEGTILLVDDVAAREAGAPRPLSPGFVLVKFCLLRGGFPCLR